MMSPNESVRFEPSSVDGCGALSPTGVARREAMLPALQAEVVCRARRRRAVRTAWRGGAVACLAVATVTLVLSNLPTPTSQPPVTLRSTGGSPEAVRILRTNPGALARYAILPTVDVRKYAIDDRQLVATLSSIGRPSGLIRRDGRVFLTRAVADPIRAPLRQRAGSVETNATPKS